MEMIKREQKLERLICEKTVQVETEGALPSPDGRAVRSVLTGNAEVTVAEAVSEEGQVRVTGRIEVNVIAQDEEGKPFSFESYAGFTQLIAIEEASPLMNAKVTSSVQELEISPAEDGAYMRASADLELSLSLSAPMVVFGGVSGASDIELSERRTEISTSKLCGKTTVRLREELPSEGAESVVCAQGTVSVRDFSTGADGAFVSGNVSLSALVVGADGRMFQLLKQIPYRERIDTEKDLSDCSCEAKMKRVYLRSLGEGFDLLSMEAEIEFTLRRIESAQIGLPLDAFSPSVPFECRRERITLLSAAGFESVQTVMKENLPLPDTAPDMASPLYASARPIVTDTVIEDGVLRTSGVLITDVVYESAGGSVNIVGFETPFSLSAEAGGANAARVHADCTVFSPACSERSVQLQYSIGAFFELWRTEELNAAVDITDPGPREKRNGVIVCFASEGETVFDIAKRYGLPCAQVKEMSPDIEEPFKEGDKLLLML